jgi:hypothetical protein
VSVDVSAPVIVGDSDVVIDCVSVAPARVEESVSINTELTVEPALWLSVAVLRFQTVATFAPAVSRPLAL